MIGKFKYTDEMKENNEIRTLPNKRKLPGMFLEDLPLLPDGAFYILYLMNRKPDFTTEVIDFAVVTWKEMKDGESTKFKFISQKKYMRKDKYYIFQLIPFADPKSLPTPLGVVRDKDITVKDDLSVNV